MCDINALKKQLASETLESRSSIAMVVIPAFNEQTTIGTVITYLVSVLNCKTVVIDDYSDDKTQIVSAIAGARVLKLPFQMGAWAATQAGLRLAHAENYHLVVTMDADGQHDPADIPRLIEPIVNGEADVTIGSSPSRGSLARKIAWSVMRQLSGLEISDPTSGYRAYNTQALAVLCQRDATNLDYQDMGILLMLQEEGLRLLEIPTKMEVREAGGSRIFKNWLAVFRYLLQTVVLCIIKRNRK